MSITPLGRPDLPLTPAPPRAADRPSASGTFAARLAQAGMTADAEGIPAAPPADVMAQVEAAAARYEELRAQGRVLSFEPDSATGRMRVEVLDAEGSLVRRIPLHEALEIATGKPLA